MRLSARTTRVQLHACGKKKKRKKKRHSPQLHYSSRKINMIISCKNRRFVLRHGIVRVAEVVSCAMFIGKNALAAGRPELLYVNIQMANNYIYPTAAISFHRSSA